MNLHLANHTRIYPVILGKFLNCNFPFLIHKFYSLNRKTHFHLKKKKKCAQLNAQILSLKQEIDFIVEKNFIYFLIYIYVYVYIIYLFVLSNSIYLYSLLSIIVSLGNTFKYLSPLCSAVKLLTFNFS